jgi:hypothetical protein
MSRKRGREEEADEMKSEIAAIVTEAIEQALKKAKEESEKKEKSSNLLAMGTNAFLYAMRVLGDDDAKSVFEKQILRIFGSVMSVEYESEKIDFLSSYPDSVTRYVISISHIHRVLSDKFIELSELEGVFNASIYADNGFVKFEFNYTENPNVIAAYNLHKRSRPIPPPSHIPYTKGEKTDLDVIATRIISSVTNYFQNCKRVNEAELPFSVSKNGQRVCTLSLSVDAPVYVDQVKFLRVDRLISGTLFTTMAGSSTLILILETVLPD